jgi:hypothetical protein
MKWKSNSNLSGNVVYHTSSPISQVKHMLCSKLHRQKGFNSMLFSYKLALSLMQGDEELRRYLQDKLCIDQASPAPPISP